MKIIQILTANIPPEGSTGGDTEEVLLGLGDDGIVYKLNWENKWERCAWEFKR